MTSLRFTSDSAHLAAHEKGLAESLGLFAVEPEDLDVTLMDTFDGRLVAEGSVLLRRNVSPDQWELNWTGLARDVDLGRLVVDRTPRLDRDALPTGPVTARLERAIDIRALLPLARVQGTARVWEKRDQRGKLVLRVVVEPASTVRSPGGRRRRALPAQIHVFGLHGYEKPFERARAAVGRLRSIEISDRPWAIDVLRAAGHDPGRDPSKIDVALDPTAPPREALRDLCASYVRVIRANREGARAALDPEFLHDLRVAVRRTRTLLKASRRLWPAPLWERFRVEFRWLARATSEARDLDVYLLDFEDLRDRLPAADRACLDPVHAWLERARDRVGTELDAQLQSERLDSLLTDFHALLTSRAFTPDGASRDESTADFAIASLQRAHRRILRDGRRIDEASPDQDLHDLRKRTKELRYLLEGFRPLFPGRKVREQIKSLKDLQENLGVHQDRVVQAHTLRTIALDLEDAPAATLVALGFLIEQLLHDAQTYRDDFARRFRAYDDSERLADFEKMLDRARRADREAAR